MNEFPNRIKFCLQNDPLVFIANGVVILCTLIILFAILVDFVSYHRPQTSKKKINSLVETGTMFFYFIFYYLLIQVDWGKFSLSGGQWHWIIIVSGITLLIVGCWVNIRGRFDLNQNWANQVTIYHNHIFIRKGIYRYIRHPLYASLIWMLIGGCFIYSSYLALLSVMLVFIPMMTYRARQEEKLLQAEFADYSEYKRNTGMFFPKVIKHDKL